MERVLQIAESGDGYLAVERTNPIIRKLKSKGELNEAMMFMMRLAHKLADLGKWQPATVAADRAIKLFPENSQTIIVALKKSFLDFAFRMNDPSGATPDYFDYVTSLSNIIGDKEYKLFDAKVKAAVSANKYFITQFSIAQELQDISHLETIDLDVNHYLAILADTTWKWCLELQKPEDMFTIQFIICRLAIALIPLGKYGIEWTQQYMKLIYDTKPESIDPAVFNDPLFNFTKLLTKAIEAKNRTDAELVVSKYQKLLEVDHEILHASKFAIAQALAPPDQQNNDLQRMFQNIIGSMFQPPPSQN